LREIRPQVHRWLSKLKNASTDGTLTIEGVLRIDACGEVEPSPELDALLNPLGGKKVRTPVATLYVERKKKSTAGLGWWIALGLLLGLLVWIGCYRYLHGVFPAPIERILHREVVLPPVTVPTAPVAPIAPEVILLDPDTAFAKPVEEPVAEPVQPTQPERAWRVVVGVYSTHQNAERAMREGDLDASQAIVFSTPGGYYRIGLGNYPDKASADRESDRLQSRFPGAWVARF
jgi:hypothetical protein